MLRFGSVASLRTVSSVPLSAFRRLVSMYFAKSHEWIRTNDAETEGTVGISNYAQDHLGEIVFVELPDVGADVSKGEGFGSLESVKISSEMFSPVSGTVVAVNEKLLEEDQSKLINSSPHKDGWVMKVKIGDKDDLKDLMNDEVYGKFCKEEEAAH